MSKQILEPTFVKGDLVSIRELAGHYQRDGVGMMISSGTVVDVKEEVVTVRIGGDLNKFAPRASDGVFERLMLPNRTITHASIVRTATTPKADESRSFFAKLGKVL